MDDLFGTLMQGEQPQPNADGTGSDQDPLAQLLQGLLGDGAPQEGGGQPGSGLAQGGLDLGSLLQGVLGGTGGLAGGTGQAPTGSAGGLGDVLGAIMGGGSPAMQSDAFLAPIVTGLAEKLGLPPQVAQAVVAFVVGKLLGHRMQPATAAVPARGRSQTAAQRSVRMDGLLQTMGSGKPVRKADIRGTGMVKELSEYTGLDRATAEASLQEVLNMLEGQLQA